MQIVMILLTAALLTNCQDFDLIGNKSGPRKGPKETENRKGQLDFTPITNIENFDINELTASTAQNSKSCSNYDSGVVSFGLVNVFKDIKNCLAKEIDTRLAPICEQERALKSYAKEVCPDEDDPRFCEDQVDEALEEVENLKDEVADEIYVVTDTLEEEIEEMSKDMKDEIKDMKNKSVINKVVRFIAKGGDAIFTLEGRQLVRFIEKKGQQVCGSSIDFSKLKKKR